MVSRDYSNLAAQKMTANILNAFNRSVVVPEARPCVVDTVVNSD